MVVARTRFLLTCISRAFCIFTLAATSSVLDCDAQKTDENAQTAAVQHKPVQETKTVTKATFEIKELKVAAAKGVTLRVRQFGKGPDIVMLTGGPGFAGEQLMPLATLLKTNFRITLPDQRGSGLSKVDAYDQGDFTFDEFVNDLEEIRKANKIERWSVLGQSWGGILAMAYASKHPDRVDALLLTGPAGIDATFWGPFRGTLMSRLDKATTEKVMSLSPKDSTPESIVALIRQSNTLTLNGTTQSEATVKELIRQVNDETLFNPRVAMALQQELFQFDLKPAFAKFDRPTLLLQGDYDPIGSDAVDLISQTIPHAKRTTIKDCGHWLFLEKTQEIEKLVRQFLDELPENQTPEK